jgi:hypothetical protein
MSLQLNKSYIMTLPVIALKNMEITYISQFQLLGINITNKLKWVLHIQSSYLKMLCYIIKVFKDLASVYILRNIYFAKFQSVISYGCDIVEQRK